MVQADETQSRRLLPLDRKLPAAWERESSCSTPVRRPPGISSPSGRACPGSSSGESARDAAPWPANRAVQCRPASGALQWMPPKISGLPRLFGAVDQSTSLPLSHALFSGSLRIALPVSATRSRQWRSFRDNPLRQSVQQWVGGLPTPNESMNRAHHRHP